jgi:hypothetical protein
VTSAQRKSTDLWDKRLYKFRIPWSARVISYHAVEAQA